MNVVYPFCVHVGGVITTEYTWSSISITVCLTKIALQTEQCFPSVRPVLVHVASMPGSITTVCPFAGSMVCSMIILSQARHFLPSVRPVSVHVGTTAVKITVFV